MKTLFALLLVSVFAIRAAAADSIPPELTGEWRSPDGNGILILRADGFGVIIGGPPPIGAPFSATYDARTFQLVISLRVSPGEMPQGAKPPPDLHLTYDPKTLTIQYKDRGMGPYKRHSEEVPEPYKSFDVKKLPKQSP